MMSIFIFAYLLLLFTPLTQATFERLPADLRSRVLYNHGLTTRDRALFAVAGKQFDNFGAFKLSRKLKGVMRDIKEMCESEAEEDSLLVDGLVGGRLVIRLDRSDECLKKIVGNVELFSPLKSLVLDISSPSSQNQFRETASNRLSVYLAILLSKFKVYDNLAKHFEELHLLSNSNFVLQPNSPLISKLLQLIHQVTGLKRVPQGFFALFNQTNDSSLLIKEYVEILDTKKHISTIHLNETSDDFLWLYKYDSKKTISALDNLSEVAISMQDESQDSDIPARIISDICTLRRNVSLSYDRAPSLYPLYEPVLRCSSVLNLSILVNNEPYIPVTFYDTLHSRTSGFRELDVTFRTSPIHQSILIRSIAEFMDRFKMTESLALRDVALFDSSTIQANILKTIVASPVLTNWRLVVLDSPGMSVSNVKTRMTSFFKQVFAKISDRPNLLDFTFEICARRVDEVRQALNRALAETRSNRKIPLYLNIVLKKDGFEYFLPVKELERVEAEWRRRIQTVKISLG